ncbi:MAG: hypothetical protein J6Z25_00405, partial [Opitutales bacterium]|nr:hypothetical protein [Opitutales bacterium]
PLSADLLNECLYTVLLKCIGPSSITTAIFFAMIISAAAIAWLMPNTKMQELLFQKPSVCKTFYFVIIFLLCYLNLEQQKDFLYWNF